MTTRALIAIVVLLLGVGQSRGAPLPEEGRPEAKRLKEEGARALEAGDYGVALERFTAAYRAFPSARLSYNIALALVELHRPLEAAEAFDAFLIGAPDAPAEALQHAQQQVTELDRQLGHLEITCAIPGALVAIDERLVGTTPLAGPVRVLPGRHRIEVSKASYQTSHMRATVGSGNTWTGETALAPVVVSTGVSRSRRIAEGIVAAGGALALGIGAGLRIDAQLEYQHLDRSCSPGCASSAWSRLPAREYAGDTMLGVAGLLVAVDVALFVIDFRRGRETRRVHGEGGALVVSF